MAAWRGLLGLVYRQIHPGFCGSSHVWGPVICHIACLVPSVPIVLMGRHRLVCDAPDYGSLQRNAWIGLWSDCVLRNCNHLHIPYCRTQRYQQIVYSNLVLKLCTRFGHSNCVLESGTEIVYSNCVLDLGTQIVYSNQVLKLCT